MQLRQPNPNSIPNTNRLRPCQPGNDRQRIYTTAREHFQRTGCVIILRVHVAGANIPGAVPPSKVLAVIMYMCGALSAIASFINSD
jgi:hypothetical protein